MFKLVKLIKVNKTSKILVFPLFMDVILVPELFRKLRETPGINIHLVSYHKTNENLFGMFSKKTHFCVFDVFACYFGAGAV